MRPSAALKVRTLSVQSISWWVIGLHMIFVGFLFFFSPSIPLVKPRRFCVQTVSLKPAEVLPQGQVAESHKGPQEAPSAPLKKETSPPKKVSKKAPPAKKLEKNIEKKAPPKKKESAKSGVKSAVAKAKEALSSLKSIQGELPKKGVGELQIEGLSGDGYVGGLVERLQSHLKLPEFGEVVVELTLLQDGSVQGVHIVDAKSVTNKSYIEKTLPRIEFPVFEGALKHEKMHTFVFVLNSSNMH